MKKIVCFLTVLISLSVIYGDNSQAKNSQSKDLEKYLSQYNASSTGDPNRFDGPQPFCAKGFNGVLSSLDASSSSQTRSTFGIQ